MLIIKIQGGIGNQLFQYAFIASVNKSVKKKISLKFFDGEMKFPREPLKIYKLLKLECTDKTSTPNLFSKFYNRSRNTYSHSLAYWLNENFGNIITEEQEFGFRKFLLKRNFEDVLLDGYYTDYRYLKNGLQEVKDAFQKLTKRFDILYEQHIAVHIRRGDYANIMRSNDKTNVLDLQYYKRCLNQINNKNLILRIYTDDYEWAKSEFPVLFEGYKFDFSPEVYSDIDSLWTMSKHQYLIGANSTFSLWAYYFGIDEIQKVMFPTEWVTSIHNKGFQLFSSKYKNVELVNEE